MELYSENNSEPSWRFTAIAIYRSPCGLTILILFLLFHRMAERFGDEDDTMNDTNEVVVQNKDNDSPQEGSADEQLAQLQALCSKLQAENRQLKDQQTGDSTAKQILKGLSDLIASKSKNTGSADNDEDSDNVGLPECFDKLKHFEKTDNVGPPIQQSIAALLAQSWRVPFRRDEIVDTLDAQTRPTNVPAVKPLEINDIVRLTKQDRINERDYRYIGNAICAAGKCLAYLLDMCSKAEGQVREAAPDDDGWVMYEHFGFDLPKVNRLLTNMAKILGMANVQTGQARRALLAYKFKPDFKRLCDRDQPFQDGKFFGPNFTNATSLITDSTKVANTAFHPKARPKSGKKWFRQSSSPYQRGDQSSMLQAAVLQQALAAAAGHPAQQSNQQQAILPSGIVGVNHFPAAPPVALSDQLTPSTAPRRGQGFRGRGRGRRGSRGRNFRM